MNTIETPTIDNSNAILGRHAFRRATGIPTVSLLVGPIGPAGRTWRQWVTKTVGNVIVAQRDRFPCVQWIQTVAEQIDLPQAALNRLAMRCEREPAEFTAEWQDKTPADQERFWNTYSRSPDDELLRELISLSAERETQGMTNTASNVPDERLVPVIIQLAPFANWPSVLFVCHTTDDLTSIGKTATQWALRVPALPLAIAVPENIWDLFVHTTPESQVKALLREGKFRVPVMESAAIERALVEAGADELVAAAVADIAGAGADTSFTVAAAEAIQASAAAAKSKAANDRARSAAERFLFAFLELLPETAGRFELNGKLDFKFGNRSAEVDLLCRAPRVALEIDGYFHFVDPDNYRRDRMKDWELQRRGFLVLRFLAEDVIPRLDSIRDRILETLANASEGETL